jgi:hypothetical protein
MTHFVLAAYLIRHGVNRRSPDPAGLHVRLVGLRRRCRTGACRTGAISEAAEKCEPPLRKFAGRRCGVHV